MTIPTFTLKSTTTATTYRFLVEQPLGGWACCTVNDATGELNITSDWGNWAHRWNIQHLGSPTLTAFIGDRTSYDYLAGELMPRDECQVFDGDKTLEACRAALLVARRRWMSTNETTTFWKNRRGYGHDQHAPLDKDLARQLWDEDLPRLCRDAESRSGDHGNWFVEDFFKLDGSVWLTGEPWDLIRTSPSSAYLVLRDGILPALAAACAEEHARRTAPREHDCDDEDCQQCNHVEALQNMAPPKAFVATPTSGVSK